MLAPGPPLDPSGDEGRSLLRRELLHSEYHQQNLWQRLLGWLGRLFDRAVGAASGVVGHHVRRPAGRRPSCSPACSCSSRACGATAGSGRARPPCSPTTDRRPPSSGAGPRRSCAEGRHGEAVVDGFRALAARQIERGRIDDQPGATAHEVAAQLAASYPQGAAGRAHRRPLRRDPLRRPAGDPRRRGRGARAGRHPGGHPMRRPRPSPGDAARRPGSAGHGRAHRVARAPGPVLRRRARPREPRRRRRPGPGPGARRSGCRGRRGALGRRVRPGHDRRPRPLVVVTGSDRLGRSTTRRLLDHQGEAGLVVVAPGPELTRQLEHRRVRRHHSPDGPVAAGCPAYDGLVLRVQEGRGLRQRRLLPRPAAASCSPSRGRASRSSAPPTALTNDQILEGDNAAVALRLLGQRTHLVWFVPRSPTSSAATASPPPSLLPAGSCPPIWLLLMTAVALVVWRSRRLGPLPWSPARPRSRPSRRHAT